MSASPAVSDITSTVERNLGMRRYLLVGGDVLPGWLKGVRPPEAPWCEVTVWPAQNGGMAQQLGSYRGTVWPSAWPSLFESHKGSAQSGPYTTITELGQELLTDAAESVRAEIGERP